MGFLDKVKAGAEQAATRAKDEARDFQLKRELSQAHAELGRKTLELLDRGELEHAELADPAGRARTVRAELEAHERERVERGTTGDGGGSDGAGAGGPAAP